jgi:hypothetical protein
MIFKSNKQLNKAYEPLKLKTKDLGRRTHAPCRPQPTMVESAGTFEWNAELFLYLSRLVNATNG